PSAVEILRAVGRCVSNHGSLEFVGLSRRTGDAGQSGYSRAFTGSDIVAAPLRRLRKAFERANTGRLALKLLFSGHRVAYARPVSVVWKDRSPQRKQGFLA